MKNLATWLPAFLNLVTLTIVYAHSRLISKSQKSNYRMVDQIFSMFVAAREHITELESAIAELNQRVHMLETQKDMLQ